MPRACTVCTHTQREAIDQALVAGEPCTAVAARYFTLSARMAVQRHKDEHLPTTLVKAQEQQDVRQALDVVAQLKAINQASLAVLKQARETGDGELALKAVDRVQRQIELQAKLLGELDERPQVNVLVAPEWLAVRGVIFAALAPYPEVRAVVAGQLLALERGASDAAA
jgi:hypothetical protein